jgi:hypothetical protein
MNTTPPGCLAKDWKIGTNAHLGMNVGIDLSNVGVMVCPGPMIGCVVRAHSPSWGNISSISTTSPTLMPRSTV